MITCPNVKVNLGLSVLRRRPDGYHDIETVFVPYFGFHDTLEIIAGDDFSRTSASLFARYGTAVSGCSTPENVCFADPTLKGPPSYDAEGGTVFRGTASMKPGPAHSPCETLSGSCTTDSRKPQLAQKISEDGKVMITIARAEGVDWDPIKDLTVKAYALLDADYNLPPVKIYLEKTSPVGAGLGGGSSDAAFALKMLNDLFSLNLDDAALAAYASRLGSDCAFFVYNRPMFGTGRGEILEPYRLEGIDFSGKGDDAGASYDLRVVVPEGVAVSTADAYRGITPREANVGINEAVGGSEPSSVAACPLQEALSRPVPEWRGSLVNDFEMTVFAKFPEIAAVKQHLYDQGAAYAAMSGSGSSVFALFPR